MTAQHLPNKTYSPPAGWRYRVPETGQLFRGVSEYQLKSQLEAHYKANSLPIPADISDRIEQFICAQEPDYCTDSHGMKPVGWKEGALHDFKTVIQGTRTLAAWLLGGKKYVDPAQAESRASTCLNCIQHDTPQGCTSCNSKELKRVVQLVVGDRRTKVHDHLKSCRVCHCQLAAKVQLPHSVLWSNMPAEQRERLPKTCWLITEQPQTITT